MQIKIIVATIALAASSAPALAGPNLVNNGGFETGDFPGWTQFGDTNFTGVQGGAFGCCAPTEGIYQAAFGPGDAFGGIIQTIRTRASKYHVSFDIANDSGEGNYVEFGGVTLLTNVPNQNYVSYHFLVDVARNPVLTFGFYNPPAFYNLDNVSVTAAVPETATWAMLIAGFGLVGATQRLLARRREAALAA